MPAQEQGLALPSREQVVEDKSEPTVTESEASTAAAISEPEVETPSTSHPPSENEPVSAEHTPVKPAAPVPSHNRSQTKPAVPLIPIRSVKAPSAGSTTQKSAKSPAAESKAVGDSTVEGAEESKASAAPKPAPSSWAALLRKNAPAQAPAPPATNGVASPTNGPPPPVSNSLGDALASFSVDSDKKISFLEPRGLVNTGNLCYMNSVS